MSKITIKQLIMLSLGLFILNSTSVFASPPTPAPVCSITGTVRSVEFKNAYDEPCLEEPYGCPTDTELRHPARYLLDVNINSAAYISGDTSFITCQDIYPVSSVQKIFINKDKVKPGDTFIVNQQIEGIVQSFWGKSFDSYTLKAKVPEPVKPTVVDQQDQKQEKDQPSTSILDSSEISEKLLQQNHIDNVSNVALQSNKQTYKVQGTRKGRLFFFVPVIFSIQLEVDAATGTMREIKKPWWAFLVR